MTHDTTAASEPYGTAGHEAHRGSACSSKFRWSALEIGTVVGGFILFWPLGLAALGVKLVKGEIWKGASDSVPPWQSYKGNWAGAWTGAKAGQGFNAVKEAFSGAWTGGSWNGGAQSSGNAAFDAYRKQQLDRLEQERRKLDEERAAFASYLDRLRRAKDQDEFDRFMAERASLPADGGGASNAG